MGPEEFRRAAHQLIDYVADYQETVRSRPVTPDVRPGYMRRLVPAAAPEQAESWPDVMADIERVIMPGMSHWHSPQFHAYYPVGNSYPALLADILSDAIGCVGISWASAPACTELEVIMMDWLGQLLRLPEEFLFSAGRGGGGVIQGSACESTLITLLAARSCKVNQVLRADGVACEDHDGVAVTPDRAALLPRLVAFASDQAHSSVARASLLSGLRIRTLPSDDAASLRGPTLRRAVEEEIQAGNIPFFVLAAIGTTASCAFDNLPELGPVCERYGLWLHIDAAYAGAACICPEFRPLLNGLEYASSFNFNPHKFMLTNLDCSALWVRRSRDLTDVFEVNPLFLKTPASDMPSYRHWAIQLSRRFRALKLWFVMRLYGAEGLRAHVRRQVALAKEFEGLVRADPRFEIAAPVTLGLVCFRLKRYGNMINDHLLSRINGARRIHMVPSMLPNETYVIRFVVCSRYTESRDVQLAWREVQRHTDELLSSTEVLSRAKMLWGSVRAASIGLRLFHSWHSV
ncbi:aromatic-L-amino-acid decarboxylase-like [Pollicipes pollicipes]|uniref:aromatic-L-amino-acid decarboxylase-like n=1 Tax=Pollicipes pollicipes TaxID=41117 RepID=UPI001884B734|nr:aromatic-L-amino-acid decarboxylase-like [Pollicipes pollicipes]